MRISDWSSDVCSSDLLFRRFQVSVQRFLVPHLPCRPVFLHCTGIAEVLKAAGPTPDDVVEGRTDLVLAFFDSMAGLALVEDPLTIDSIDRKRTRLHSSHYCASSMPYSACQKQYTHIHNKPYK